MDGDPAKRRPPAPRAASRPARGGPVRAFARLGPLALAFSLGAPGASAAPAGTAAERAPADFSADYDQVFQVRVVSSAAGAKASIGSGFRADADGRLLTNYHVVADFVDSPERYAITYVGADGRRGRLELLDFDVVGDLAVLRHPVPGSDHLELAARAPAKGATVHALGNPGDWGVVRVPGPVNGLVERRYERRLLFSGSLNSGMSGGPSLDAAGRVIGVNVATAGSQLSFLVPVERARELLARRRALDPARYDEEIARQIKAWQRIRLGTLIDAPWPRENLDARTVLGEFRRDFRCWGDSNEHDEERAVTRVGKTCRAGDSVYVDADLEVGNLSYSFVDSRPERLNAFQFARSQLVHLGAPNRSAFRHSTGFRCESDFVRAPAAGPGRYDRTITCLRAYRRLPGLFDSVHAVVRVDGDGVHRSTLSVSGAEPDQIRALNRRFAEALL